MLRGTRLHIAAEGKAGQDQRQVAILLLRMVHDRQHVLHLAVAAVEFAFAGANAAEVEAQCDEVQFHKCLCQCGDNLVIHCAAHGRQRMRDHHDRARFRVGQVREPFKVSDRAVYGEFFQGGHISLCIKVMAKRFRR